MIRLGGSDIREFTCNTEDLGSIPGLGRSPGEGNGNLLQHPCSGNSMDRGLYSPWGCKESDKIEWLSLHFHIKLHFNFWTSLETRYNKMFFIISFYTIIFPLTLKILEVTKQRKEQVRMMDLVSVWGKIKVGAGEVWIR